MKKIISTLAALFALATTATAGIDVQTFPLPSCFTSVIPSQGEIDLAGSVCPLGASEITFTWAGNASDMELNKNCATPICIYIDGEETPAEQALVKDIAYKDSMGYNTIGFRFVGTYTDPGMYIIVVPEGAFLYNGAPTPEVKLGYEIYIPYQITPAPGLYTELTDFTMVFHDYNEVRVKMNGSFYPALGTDTFILQPQVVQEEGVYPNKVHIELSHPCVTPGDYRFFFDAGAFELVAYGPNYENDKSDCVIEYTKEIQLVYHVPFMSKPTISPAEGEVDGFRVFEVAYPDNFGVMLMDDKKTNYIYRLLPGNKLSSAPLYQVKATKRSGNKVTLNVINPDTGAALRAAVNPGPGTYVLKLSEIMYGSIGTEMVNSDPWEFVYEIEPQTFNVTTSPSEGFIFDELSEISINFPYATNMAINPSCAEQPSISDANGPVEGVTVFIGMDGGISPLADGANETDLVANVSFVPTIKAKGTYTLSIPAGYFNSGSKLSPAYKLKYSVTGNAASVFGIEADETADVYTITGICVARQVSADDVIALPAGLYIVNGKKVAIK